MRIEWECRAAKRRDGGWDDAWVNIYFWYGEGKPGAALGITRWSW